MTLTSCLGSSIPIPKPMDETRITAYDVEAQYYTALKNYDVLSDDYCAKYFYEEADWDASKPIHKMQRYCNDRVKYVGDIYERFRLSYVITYEVTRFTWSQVNENIDKRYKNFVVEISYEHIVEKVPPASIGNVTPIDEMRRLYQKKVSELREYTMYNRDGNWIIYDLIITPVQGGFD